MEIIIRRAVKKDIPHMTRLAANVTAISIPPSRTIDPKIVKEFRLKDLECLEQLLERPQVGIFVAETDSGEFAGHVMGYNGEMDGVTGEIQGWVFDLAVEDKFRKKGIGEKLMKRFFEFSKAAGMKYVGLLVTTNNLPAITLYEKMGFIEERKRMAIKLV